MAVLIEGVSVIFPMKYLKTKYQGGEEQFQKDCPMAFVVNDGELMSLLFPPNEGTLEKVAAFLEVLEGRGLCVMENDRYVDVVVVDQWNDKPLGGVACDWLEIHLTQAGLPEKIETVGPKKAADNDDEDEDEAEEALGAENMTAEELSAYPTVRAARLVDGTAQGLGLPKDWAYELSFSRRFGLNLPNDLEEFARDNPASKKWDGAVMGSFE